MSTFRAEVVRVEVRKHPDADRLDIVKPVGKAWQCVDMRDRFKTGDLAVYFPVDSVLSKELVRDLGIEKYYHSHLKTIKLRGYISQGMVVDLKTLHEKGYLASKIVAEVREGDDFNKFFFKPIVTKYEEIIPVNMSGVKLPSDGRFVEFTNIENFKNFPDVFEVGEPVVITEKIHGTNFRTAVFDEDVLVGSHAVNLAPPRDHTAWERFKAFFGAKLPQTNKNNLYWRAAYFLEADDRIHSGEQVFGEIYGSGIQDLDYGIKDGEFDVAIIGVMKDGLYLGDADLDAYCAARSYRRVPVVYRGPWKADLVALAGGMSTLAPTQIREGVVVTPQREQYSERLGGRKIIKIISDEYLLRKDATERH